ncbi:MAG: Putative thiazole biosynthetic enzyme [candidate division TA06 bacterium 32_111]|uniref:Thiamine thiazole synthase n=2 Tax=Bacteria candidate phyla TaxID=1783234 RepID=A0A101I4P2_UNCT6|nr:MAG: Putative thiazole biosynthetic enzyme [candidate division TA06 bacterium 32_111]KUK87870.1 MAG: Putative thiazole biosynthetic enzyme [candidate division TA06 bacterium 34_109]HAF08023.1 ribose 1,5-bisphosphate isomerase [candidate division WOR-3 bacterium]HCP16276.1 ribose 1,5-bisphosphate isomerase [candidate division WOR-3 bacterium]
MLEDQKISELIVKNYFEKLKVNLSLDVAIVGGGPSGLVAGYHLAKDGFKVALFETKLAPGGGMWGGGMMFNEIVVQKESLDVLKDFDVDIKDEGNGYFLIDSVQITSSLIYKSSKAGVKIFNLIKVVDVVLKDNSVCGVVINWTPVEYMSLHVDPLTVVSKKVLDATGHPAEIASILVKKANVKLNTPSGKIEGEKPMNAELGEMETVENTKEIFKNFYVSGMAANGVFGGFRMGPIFGGMLLSGYKSYKLIKEDLRKE